MDEAKTLLIAVDTSKAVEGTAALSPVDELIEVCTRLTRDKGRLLEICHEIDAGSTDQRSGQTKAPRKSMRGRKPAAGRRVGKADQAAAGGVERVKLEPWRKVLCSRCGTKTGAIRKGPGAGELYPSRHRDGAGDPCPGVEQPAKLATEE